MKELTDEELNIAVGKFTGNPFKNYTVGIEALGNMHEAEKGLTPEQAQKYFLFVRAGVGIPPEGEEVTIRNFYIHATARQRAIALLRVVKPEVFQ